MNMHGHAVGLIHERVEKLKSFTNALADGVVTKQELAGQEQRLLAAMKKVEADLSDDQHGKVTTVLVELTAYNIMHTLHQLVESAPRTKFRG